MADAHSVAASLLYGLATSDLLFQYGLGTSYLFVWRAFARLALSSGVAGLRQVAVFSRGIMLLACWCSALAYLFKGRTKCAGVCCAAEQGYGTRCRGLSEQTRDDYVHV